MNAGKQNTQEKDHFLLFLLNFLPFFVLSLY